MTMTHGRRHPESTDDTPDTGDMVAVHQMFRTELRTVTTVVAATSPGDIAQVKLITTHLRLVLDFLDNHHEGEDAILWPLLEAKTVIDPELKNLMAVHHHELHRLIGAVREQVTTWTAQADPHHRDLLALHLRQLQEILRVHLDAEESFVLPLVQRHLSVKEWHRIAAHGAAGTPRRPCPALILLGSILADAEPAARDSFWATLPPPARLAWHVAGEGIYRRHRRRLQPASHA